MQETSVQSLGQEDPLEEGGMATYSSILIHGKRSLVGYSPCGGKESDTTKVTECAHRHCWWILHCRATKKSCQYYITIIQYYQLIKSPYSHVANCPKNVLVNYL